MGGGLNILKQLGSGHKQRQEAKEEDSTSQSLTYTHTHTTQTHAHPNTLLPGGGAGAALTQEVRKPGGQRSHNFQPFKTLSPTSAPGLATAPLSPAPRLLRQRSRPHLERTSAPTRLPHTPPPNSAALSGTAPAPKRLCAAPQ